MLNIPELNDIAKKFGCSVVDIGAYHKCAQIVNGDKRESAQLLNENQERIAYLYCKGGRKFEVVNRQDSRVLSGHHINHASKHLYDLMKYVWKYKELNQSYMKKTGIELITEERNRQIEKEGWDEKHDLELVYSLNIMD